ncbi:hypothetical protein TRV_04746 [Trichophyton verrucosum HKI 0517]|uniref:Uncharacterized protein n=1 Tax=Trichophyton verrucosum (strain HKI 0517) TaxID=663202 RepID=D4DC94_TRIVH|nr:uncharacterized protein TRV_04746 [Trichophyton verrucosum HKI 0517]EFE40514.1 hypothetical protein TRV_04746 [Trichophyton verrucosum HKI 0517]
MPGSTDIISFPVNKGDWTSAATKCKLKNESIHSKTCNSASKISEEQYLLLRSFWVTRSPGTIESWGIKTISKATEWLREYDDWQKYLKNLGSQATMPVPRLGSFSYVCLSRLQVTRLPEEYEEEEEDKNVNFSPIASRLRSSDYKVFLESPTKAAAERKGLDQSMGTNKFAQMLQQLSIKEGAGDNSSDEDIKGKGKVKDDQDESASITGSDSSHAHSWVQMSPNSFRKAFPKVEDEQIVNGFLIAFLATLCMHHPEVELEWSPVRKGFKFGKSPDTAGETKSFLFEARTDGHLSKPVLRKTDIRSTVIVEVKPTLRAYNNRVIYQATAQMAAWIYEEPDEPGSQEPYRRAMILQERQEIRLVIAKYDSNYVNYLKNTANAVATISLLEMHEVRVWDIEKENEMKEFGNILLALVLQGGKLLH